MRAFQMIFHFSFRAIFIENRESLTIEGTVSEIDDYQSLVRKEKIKRATEKETQMIINYAQQKAYRTKTIK